MKIAYFDCFSGASGDMILGACLDTGLDLGALRESLAGLKLSGYSLNALKVRKQGFSATQAEVVLEDQAGQSHRHLKHIREILQAATLSPRVRERALAVFTRLAEAEAAAHGTDIEKVHFHEVGAIDAIVDITGACAALELLGVEKVYCSPIPTGSGTVQCDHGLMPVPAPATANLLSGVPLAACDEVGELTTPTGAAILTTLAESFGPLPAMTLERTGIGAGRREGKNRPNILRLLIGTPDNNSSGSLENDEVIVLEANLDDISAEVVGYVVDRLLAAGALDAYTSPIYMKKNRPAVLLTVLAEPAAREAIEAILFEQTSTFGVRMQRAQRRKLVREHETVQTSCGPIRIKIGRREGQIMTAAAEFEDCRAAAEQNGRPLKDVMDEAMRVWRSSRI